jgi:Group II intron, maturase-specific domain
MQNVTSFLRRRLRLKVNEAKSAVARPQERKFLGFSFTYGAEAKRRIAPKALLRCKQRVRELTRRTRGISVEQMTKELASYLGGWKSYFGFSQTPSVLRRLEEWIRRRLRSMIWKQWKRPHAVCEAAPAEHRRCSRGSNRRQSPWTMAHRQQPGPVVCVSDCLLRRARSSAIAGRRLAQPN